MEVSFRGHLLWMRHRLCPPSNGFCCALPVTSEEARALCAPRAAAARRRRPPLLCPLPRRRAPQRSPRGGDGHDAEDEGARAGGGREADLRDGARGGRRRRPGAAEREERPPLPRGRDVRRLARGAGDRARRRALRRAEVRADDPSPRRPGGRAEVDAQRPSKQASPRHPDGGMVWGMGSCHMLLLHSLDPIASRHDLFGHKGGARGRGLTSLPRRRAGDGDVGARRGAAFIHRAPHRRIGGGREELERQRRPVLRADPQRRGVGEHDRRPAAEPQRDPLVPQGHADGRRPGDDVPAPRVLPVARGDPHPARRLVGEAARGVAPASRQQSNAPANAVSRGVAHEPERALLAVVVRRPRAIVALRVERGDQHVVEEDPKRRLEKTGARSLGRKNWRGLGTPGAASDDVLNKNWVAARSLQKKTGGVWSPMEGPPVFFQDVVRPLPASFFQDVVCSPWPGLDACGS
eukprot:gene9942-biopygen2921